MIKSKFNLEDIIARLPEVSSVLEETISIEDATLYPSIAEIETLKALFLLDSFFKALDDCLLKPKTDASSSQLRNLIKNIAYDSGLYPRFDYCVYDYIVRGIDFKHLNQSKKEDNIIKKEIDFADMLMSTLESPNEKFPWIVSAFLLYEFNKISHLLDGIIYFCYDKSCCLYPNFFILLNKTNKGSDSPEKWDRFIFIAETLFSIWSEAIFESLRDKIAIAAKRNAVDIISCLKEMQSLPCVQDYYKEYREIKLIADCWGSTKRKLQLISKNTIEHFYYKLISQQKETINPIANLTPKTQNSIIEKVTQIPGLVEYMNWKEDFYNIHSDGHEMFNLDRMIGGEIIDDEIENQWQIRNNFTKKPFQYNPFSPSITPEITSASMVFPDNIQGCGFGCPLRILQRPVNEIENIYMEASLLSTLRVLRRNMILERIVYNNSPLSLEQKKNKIKEVSSDYISLRKIERHAMEDAEVYSKAFYHLINCDERYLQRLRSLIPFDKNDRIPEFATKNGYLHIVYRQSLKRWISIQRIFCKVSFGDKALAKSDEKLQFFTTGCHGNKAHYCRKCLSKILRAINEMPLPSIDSSFHPLE